jgi:anti-anti-sigma factor
MAKSTIRLPEATPHAYLAWVTWWKDVEELMRSDLAIHPDPRVREGEGLVEARARGIVDEHLFLIEEEAKLAIEAGRGEIAPELTAEPDQWNQWIRYGRRRKEWLEALALKELPDRGFPESVETLWQGTMKVIQAVVSDHLVLHNVSLIPEDEPGRFLLWGELEVANIEAIGERLEAELRAGHRLGLDLSGLKFIDSQGVHLLVRLAALAAELDLAPVALIAPSEEVVRVLAIAVPEGIPGLDVHKAGNA